MTAGRLFTNQNAIGPDDDLTTTDIRSQQRDLSQIYPRICRPPAQTAQN